MKVKHLENHIRLSIINLRKKLNLSQRKFALNAGIDQAHFNKIEKGHMGASLINLQKIALAYKIPIKYFFEIDNKKLLQNKKEPTVKKEIVSTVYLINEEWKLQLILVMIKHIQSIKEFRFPIK